MNLQNVQQKNGMSLMMKITEYGEENESDSSIKFQTKVIKPSLCDYLDAYIFVTGDITAEGGDGNSNVTFKNCALFTRRVTHINDEHTDTLTL